MRPHLIERYIFWDIVKGFILTLVIISAIFVIGTTSQRVHSGFPLQIIIGVWHYAILYTLPFTIPLSLLISISLVYSRLAIENEFLAMRATGMATYSVLIPAILLGLVLTLGTWWLQQRIIPHSYWRVKNLVEGYVLDFLQSGSGTDRLMKISKKGWLHCSSFDGQRLKGIVFVRNRGSQKIEITAPEATISMDKTGENLILHMPRAWISTYDNDPTRPSRRATGEIRIPLPVKRRSYEGPKYMGTAELNTYVKEKQKILASLMIFPKTEIDTWEEAKQIRLFNDIRHLKGAILKADITRHKRWVLSLAPFLFAIIGAPLSIFLGRDNRLVPFLAGFICLFALFFGPLLMSEKIVLTGGGPVPIMWSAVFLSGVAGTILLGWANRR